MNTQEQQVNDNNTPKLTLKEAVVQSVTNLSKNPGKFSVKEVTDDVREGANSGEFLLPGLEAQANNEGITYWVKHEDVKAIVNELEADGTLTTLGLTGIDYGAFRTFNFGSTTTNTTDADFTTDVDNDTVDNTLSPLAQRVQNYLDSWEVVHPGTSPTLKQVQSAMKVKGVTCKDFYEIITDELGYDVSAGTTEEAYSTYQVE